MKTTRLQFESLGRREVFSASSFGELAVETAETSPTDSMEPGPAEIDFAFSQQDMSRPESDLSSFMADPDAEPTSRWEPPILANGHTFPYENGTSIDIVYNGQEDDGLFVVEVGGTIYVGGEPDLDDPPADPPADPNGPAADPPGGKGIWKILRKKN